MKKLAHVLRVGAVLSLLSCNIGAEEAHGARVHFMLDAQPLRVALNHWAEQAGLSVVLPAGQRAAERITSRVEGQYSPQKALDLLLEGSGLTYAFVDDKTVAIREKERAEKPAAASKTQVAEGMRIAQAEETAKSENDQNKDDQVAPASSGQLQEIVVTAQRRTERLQDVPISISVLSGDELDRSTLRSATEALSRVPGVAVDEGFQSGGTQITVRGVTAASGFAFGSSPIGYYLDSAPFGLIKSAIAPDPTVYDLDRVEVLRGPHGTLYGAGGVGGVVRVLTREANPEEFEFKARTDFSATEDGGMNGRADTAINIPLVADKVAVRAVLGYQDLSGWIDRPGREDANDGRLRSARIKLDAQPTEELSIGLSAWISRNEFGAMSTSADNRTNPNNDVEKTSNEFDSYGLKIGYDFPSLSLASMTSYLDYADDGYLDFTYSFGVPGRVLRTNPTVEVFAQEVSLNSTQEGPWRWTAGGIYRDAKDRTLQSYNAGFIYPGLTLFTSKSWAAFGELTRVFLDGQIELTGGLRYFEDDAGVDEESRLGNAVPAQFISREKTFHSTTPRFVLAWHPQDRAMLYASYAEGFRSGFDQSPGIIVVAPSIPPAEPDLLKNYELGAKGTLWNGRVAYDAAVYYMDWQDVQLPINVIVDGVGRAAVINGGSASGTGVDLALTTRPTRDLELGVNVSWNNLETDSDVLSGGLILFNEGERLNHSPEFTVGAFGHYAFPLGRGGVQGRISASANLTAERSYRSLQGTTLVVRTGDELLVSRMAFSVEWPARWTATLFADNLNNESGAVARQPFTAHGNDFEDWDTRIRPRTIGVQLDYRY